MPYGDYSCRLLAHSLSCIYWLSVCFFIPAPCGGRFTVDDDTYFTAVLSQLDSTHQFHRMSSIQPWQALIHSFVCLCFLPLCGLYLRSSDISQHLCRIIIHALCQYYIKDPDYFTCDRHYRLHLFQGILPACPIILMDRLKLRIPPNQWQRCFIQYVSQAFPTSVADSAFPFVLSGLIRHNRIACQLLQLFGIIETLNVPPPLQ